MHYPNPFEKRKNQSPCRTLVSFCIKLRNTLFRDAGLCGHTDPLEMEPVCMIQNAAELFRDISLIDIHRHLGCSLRRENIASFETANNPTRRSLAIGRNIRNVAHCDLFSDHGKTTIGSHGKTMADRLRNNASHYSVCNPRDDDIRPDQICSLMPPNMSLNFVVQDSPFHYSSRNSTARQHPSYALQPSQAVLA